MASDLAACRPASGRRKSSIAAAPACLFFGVIPKLNVPVQVLHHVGIGGGPATAPSLILFSGARSASTINSAVTDRANSLFRVQRRGRSGPCLDAVSTSAMENQRRAREHLR